MRKIAPPPVRDQSVRIKHHHIAQFPAVLRHHWTRCVEAQNSTRKDEIHPFRTTKHASLDVANAGERQRARPPVEPCEPHHDTPSCKAGASHPSKNFGQWLVKMTLDVLPSGLGGAKGKLAVTQTIDHTHQCTLSPLLNHARVALPR